MANTLDLRIFDEKQIVPNGKLEDLVTAAIKLLEAPTLRGYRVCCYLLFGVTDLLDVKQGHGYREVVLRSGGEALLRSKIDWTVKTLREKKMMTVLCSFPPISFVKHNQFLLKTGITGKLEFKTTYAAMQTEHNEQVANLNKWIEELNCDSGVVTCQLSAKLFVQEKGRYMLKDFYLKDGLHPTSQGATLLNVELAQNLRKAKQGKRSPDWLRKSHQIKSATSISFSIKGKKEESALPPTGKVFEPKPAPQPMKTESSSLRSRSPLSDRYEASTSVFTPDSKSDPDIMVVSTDTGRETRKRTRDSPSLDRGRHSSPDRYRGSRSKIRRSRSRSREFRSRRDRRSRSRSKEQTRGHRRDVESGYESIGRRRSVDKMQETEPACSFVPFTLPKVEDRFQSSVTGLGDKSSPFMGEKPVDLLGERTASAYGSQGQSAAGANTLKQLETLPEFSENQGSSLQKALQIQKEVFAHQKKDPIELQKEKIFKMLQGEREKNSDPFDQALNQIYQVGPGSEYGYGYAHQAVRSAERGADEQRTPGYGEVYRERREARGYGGYGGYGGYE